MSKLAKDFKVNVGITHGEKLEFSHFCYVPADLKLRFDMIYNVHDISLQQHVKEWARIDFGIYVDSREDLEQLKDRIKAKYSQQYPELTNSSHQIDRMGWRRRWVMDKMERCINED